MFHGRGFALRRVGCCWRAADGDRRGPLQERMFTAQRLFALAGLASGTMPELAGRNSERLCEHMPAATGTRGAMLRAPLGVLRGDELIGKIIPVGGGSPLCEDGNIKLLMFKLLRFWIGPFH